MMDAEDRQKMTGLHKILSDRFGVGNIELREGYEQDLYLSIPTGHNEALEIEWQEMDETYNFTRRQWDRTGGLAYDEEIAQAKHPHLAVGVVDAEMKLYAERAEQEERDAAFFG